MGFLSFLKRGEANEAGDRGAERGRSGDGGRGRARGGAEAVDDVQQLRLRARRRLRRALGSLLLRLGRRGWRNDVAAGGG